MPVEPVQVPVQRSHELVATLQALGATVAELHGTVEGWVELHVFPPADPGKELACRAAVEASGRS